MKQLNLNNHSYKVLLQDFKQWLDILGYAPTTVYYLPLHLREFFHYLETHDINKLDHIQTHHITRYYHHLKIRPHQRSHGGLSGGYLNKHQQALFKFREYLKHHNHKGINIHLKHEQGNARDHLQVLTQQEIKQLFTVTNYSHNQQKIRWRDKAMLVCFYSCGLRRNEVVHLDRSDILFDKQRLFVRQGKNYKERFVPLNKHSMDILEYYLYDHRPAFYPDSNRNKENEALFLNYRGGRLQGQSFANRLAVLLQMTDNKELQSKNITLHSLRHSIATHLMEQGAHIEQISNFLGHNSLESTQIYTHFLKQHTDAYLYELSTETGIHPRSHTHLPKSRSAMY